MRLLSTVRLLRDRWNGSLLVLGCSLVFSAGCPAPIDDGNGGTNGDGMDDVMVTGTINNVNSNFGVSVSLPTSLTVLYSVTGQPDSIVGFYVPVADTAPGSAPVGDRIIVATNLPSGSDQAFSFLPSAAGVGLFRVGVLMNVDTEEIIVQSSGTIQVQGPPNPMFVRPSEPLTFVQAGASVEVSFDVGDPEGDALWRLFFLATDDDPDLPADQLGTEIAVASATGNSGMVLFQTAGLAPGEYELGLSATDSGSTVAGTVVNGESDRIVTVLGPTIRVE